MPFRAKNGSAKLGRAAQGRAAQLRTVRCFETLEARLAMAVTPLPARFDFGTSSSPVESGFTRITEHSAYAGSTGFGWSSGAISSYDRGTGTSATRDFNYTPDGTFNVDLPNGRYKVDAILGDLGRYAHDQVGIYFENVLRDTVSTAAYQVVSRSYEVQVADSQLTLRMRDLGGSDRNGVIESLQISSLGPVIPQLSIADATALEGAAGTNSIVFSVQLTSVSQQEIRVNFATQNGTALAGSDYVSASGTLRIPAGQTRGTISVSILGDSVVEPDETFSLALSSPIGATLSRTAAIATLRNDDEPLTLRLSVARATFLENDKTANLATLSRTGPTTSALSVTLQSSDSTEATVPATVQIPAGQSSVTFAVVAVDDSVVDGSQNVSVTAAASGYIKGILQLRVEDNERPAFVTHYDFGTASSTLSPGYTAVSEAVTYTASRGYGWSAGQIRSADRGGRSAVLKDFNFTTDGTFLVNLPNGTYTVDLILGDTGGYAHDNMGVYLEGLLVATVSTNPGQVVARSFQVNVVDSQLTFRLKDLGGRDANAVIEAMRISASPLPSNLTPWWPAKPGIPNGIFSEPGTDSSGFISYTVTSPYQRSSNTVRVLLPSTYNATQKYKVVYVLPVEIGAATQFGDGISTVRSLGLQNSNNVIFVAPTFTNMPWYADNSGDSSIWQETYFRTVVVPFIETQYSTVPGADGRLLLGFSKSGYGAVSMLLRHPETFGKAVAWDSPLNMSDPATGYGFLGILGSTANFNNNYKISSLLATRGSALKNQPPRIALQGYSYGFTHEDHKNIDALMTSLSIPHVYNPGVYRQHHWNSGWVKDAVGFLTSVV